MRSSLTSRMRGVLVSPPRRCLHSTTKQSDKSTQQCSAEAAAAQESSGEGEGLFGNELLRSPAGLRDLHDRTLKECTAIKKRIFFASDSRSVVKGFDDLSNTICLGADLTECVHLLHQDESWQREAADCMHSYVNLVESLNTNHDLYATLKLAAHPDFGGGELDAVDSLVAGLLLHDFEQSGVQLEAEQRRRFVALSQHVFTASAAFTRACDQPSVVAPTHLPLPPDPHGQLQTDGSGQVLLNDAFLWSHNPQLRAFGYENYYRYNADSAQLLHEFLSARHELAKLTGFTSYAERAQAHTLLGKATAVEDFLDGLLSSLRPVVQRELTVLQQYNGDQPINMADLSYLITKYRYEKFNVGDHAYEPFLSVDNVVRGFGVLLRELYGCSLAEVRPSKHEVWSRAVRKFIVRDETGVDLGVIYGDFESRHNKHGGDCHMTVRCSKQLAKDTFQTPIVVLSLSLAPGATAFSPAQAENAWHELGHAMHSMFGKTRHQHVAGTRTTTDLAETPSNLMEYFFYAPTVQQRCLSTTDHSLSAELAEKLAASRKAFQTCELQLQVVHALLDLQLHDGVRHNMNKDESLEHYHALCDDHLGIRPPADSYWPHRFAHLVPYGAKYYCYHVANACAGLIWRERFAGRPFDAEAGAAWRRVQARGGELPMRQLMQDVVGYEPTGQRLTETLRAEADDALKVIS